MGIDVNYLALYLAIMKNYTVDKALKKLDIPTYNRNALKAVIKNRKIREKNNVKRYAEM
jgi:hypothetical protein